MKVEVQLNKKSQQSYPKVGEMWTYKTAVPTDNAFIRIDDDAGYLAHQGAYSRSKFFFSLELSSGRIVVSSRLEGGRIMLAPKGGTLVVVPKENT